MANEKKIAKNQKLFLSWLEHVIEVENQLQNAEDNKKIEKLQKKLKKNKDMVVYNGKLIGVIIFYLFIRRNGNDRGVDLLCPRRPTDWRAAWIRCCRK